MFKRKRSLRSPNKSSSRSPSKSSSRSPSKSPPTKKKTTNENTTFLLRKREIGMLPRNPRNKLNFSNYNMFNDTQLYSIEINQLYDILRYNKNIKLYLYNIDDNNNVKLKKYNNLCLYRENYAQDDLFSYYNSSGELINVSNIFHLYGTNINNKNDSKTLFNNGLMEHLYVDKKFTTLYLFKYTYYYEYGREEQQQKKIKEKKIFGDFIKYYKIKLIKNKSDDFINDPKFKFFDDLSDEVEKNFRYVEIDCYNDPSEDNDKYNSDWNKGSLSNNSSYGAGNIKFKYIKRLKNKSLEKLQNIAKNKKIKYTKKFKGKTIAIKKETLINKLCNHKYKK